MDHQTVLNETQISTKPSESTQPYQNICFNGEHFQMDTINLPNQSQLFEVDTSLSSYLPSGEILDPSSLFYDQSIGFVSNCIISQPSLVDHYCADAATVDNLQQLVPFVQSINDISIKPEYSDHFVQSAPMNNHYTLINAPFELAGPSTLKMTSVDFDLAQFLQLTNDDHVEPSKTRKMYKCDFQGCTKRYNQKWNLTRHIRYAHTGHKPFECTWNGCKWTFAQGDALRVHMRQHTGERPYGCHISGCEAKFAAKGGLNRHQQSHARLQSANCETMLELKANHRLFACGQIGCEAKFTRKANLTRHQKHKHNNPV